MARTKSVQGQEYLEIQEAVNENQEIQEDVIQVAEESQLVKDEEPNESNDKSEDTLESTDDSNKSVLQGIPKNSLRYKELKAFMKG